MTYQTPSPLASLSFTVLSWWPQASWQFPVLRLLHLSWPLLNCCLANSFPQPITPISTPIWWFSYSQGRSLSFSPSLACFILSRAWGTGHYPMHLLGCWLHIAASLSFPLFWYTLKGEKWPFIWGVTDTLPCLQHPSTCAFSKLSTGNRQYWCTRLFPTCGNQAFLIEHQLQLFL